MREGKLTAKEILEICRKKSYPDYFITASLFEEPAAKDEESCQDDHQEDDAHCPVLYHNSKRILKKLFVLPSIYVIKKQNRPLLCMPV